MPAGPDAQFLRGRLLVMWILWGSILAGLVIIHLLLGQKPVKPPTAAALPINLIGLAPLFVSVVLRFLVLPRCRDYGRLLAVFVAGMASAEACGILGIFFGGPYRDSLFLLGVLGITSHVPLFARRLLEPKGTGFIPNN